MNLVFSSRVSKQHRPALEELLFFNPGQFRVRSGIINSLEKFGHPRLEDAGENLSISIGEREAQTLFVFDRGLRDSAPVGLVIFLRTSQEEIAIIHVAVHADYALQGNHGDLGLGTILVEKVKEIASRIVGVRRIIFFYRSEVVIRLQT